MKYEPEIALGYKDIYLVPNKCIIDSRQQASTSYLLRTPYHKTNTYMPNLEARGKDIRCAKIFSMPVIPANMQSVVSPVVYEKYCSLGLMPIMHRFNVNALSFLQGVASDWKAISVGVKPYDFNIVTSIAEKLAPSKWPTCICIDIAHGHADSVSRMISLIYATFSEQRPCIIAGNVTTPDAVRFLQDAGADVIKVGIGPGQVCSTKDTTGFHVPMFTAVMQCSEVATVPIIADGGIREDGDIAKALVAGADLVMIGGIFAACTDSPAEIIEGKKEYYGSASSRNKGYSRHIEGFATHLTPTMTIEERVNEMRDHLQSSISYAGGHDLSALDLSKVKYNIVRP